MNNHIFILILLLNIITAIVFIYDKHAAKTHKYRISEKCLLLLSIFGAATTLYLLMFMINHKTRKPKFTIFVPLIIFIQFATCLFIL